VGGPRGKCRRGQNGSHIMPIETTVFDMWAVVHLKDQPVPTVRAGWLEAS